MSHEQTKRPRSCPVHRHYLLLPHPKTALAHRWRILPSRASQLLSIIDAVAGRLVEIGTADWFIVVRIEVTDQRAMMRYLDGNGKELVGQKIATQTSRSQTSRSRPPGTASIGSSCCTVSIEHVLLCKKIVR